MRMGSKAMMKSNNICYLGKELTSQSDFSLFKIFF